MIIANEGAQLRTYQYYVIVCLSVPLQSSFESFQLSRSSDLSKCRHDDQPRELTSDIPKKSHNGYIKYVIFICSFLLIKVCEFVSMCIFLKFPVVKC